MRTSVMRSVLAFALVVLLGAGCETFEKYCKPCQQKKLEAQIALTNKPPEEVDLTRLLESNEVKNAQTAVPFDQLPIDPNAKLEAVQFGFDSSLLAQRELKKIEKAAQYLLDHPDRVMHVDGHCDERGSNEYNISLGEHRALAVRKYLMDLGIDGSRVQTRSFGKEKPLDPGHNEAAWAKNRRGEFVVYIKK